jgi:hypothetical protein
VPFLIIRVCVRLNVFPAGPFHEPAARHVPSNRLIELELDEPIDLCFDCADSGVEGATGGDGFCSKIGAGSRCAEIISRVELRSRRALVSSFAIQSNRGEAVNSTAEIKGPD